MQDFDLAMLENLMTQWVEDKARHRGYDTPSGPDPVLSKQLNTVQTIKYQHPQNKSNRLLMDLKEGQGMVGKKEGTTSNRNVKLL